jgi:hypothetical protein
MDRFPRGTLTIDDGEGFVNELAPFYAQAARAWRKEEFAPSLSFRTESVHTGQHRFLASEMSRRRCLVDEMDNTPGQRRMTWSSICPTRTSSRWAWERIEMSYDEWQ